MYLQNNLVLICSGADSRFFPAVFDGQREGLPVVGHGLRQLQRLRGQVLGSVKFDAQLAGLQRDISGEIPQPAFLHVRRGGDANPPRREMAARAVEFLDHAGTAVHFPLKEASLGCFFQTRDQGQPGDRRSVSGPQTGNPAMSGRARR